jgi:O-antigen/teichoic acid export membrane protein
MLFYVILLAVSFASYSIIMSIIKGLHKFRHIAVLEMIMGGFTFIIFITLISTGKKDFILPTVASIAGYLIFSVFGLIFLRKNLSLNPADFKAAWLKKLLTYGSFAVFGGVAGAILANIDRILLNYFHNSTDIGIYSAYFAASTVAITPLIQLFLTVFFPTASKSTDKKQILNKINKLSKKIFIIVFIVSITSTYLILRLYGSKYPVYYLLILLFGLSIAFSAIYQVNMWFLNAIGVKGVKTTIKGTLSAAGLNFILNILLIPKLFIYGAILATIFSTIYMTFYFKISANKIVGLEINKNEAIR